VRVKSGATDREDRFKDDRFRMYGVAGGLAVAPSELALRPAGQRTEDFNDLMLPMYPSLGVSIGF
jgi:hypothetical protein